MWIINIKQFKVVLKMEKFNNYSTLLNTYPELATRLKNNVVGDIWIDKPITLFNSLQEYGLFEMESGYYDHILNRMSFGNVPYIDLEEFAQEVLLFSYQLTYYDKDKQVVLSTCYQWN